MLMRVCARNTTGFSTSAGGWSRTIISKTVGSSEGSWLPSTMPTRNRESNTLQIRMHMHRLTRYLDIWSRSNYLQYLRPFRNLSLQNNRCPVTGGIFSVPWSFLGPLGVLCSVDGNAVIEWCHAPICGLYKLNCNDIFPWEKISHFTLAGLSVGSLLFVEKRFVILNLLNYLDGIN